MKVPPGLKEYEDSVKEAKNLLNRLKKGNALLEEAAKKGEVIQARKIIDLWYSISKELFTNLELATLIHQQYLTGNSVLLKSDGSLAKIEDLMEMNPEDRDPWTLLTVQKLYEVFGEDYKELMEIKQEESPIN